MTSLTGDAALDRLIPAAARLTCGLREFNPDEVTAALDDAAHAHPGTDGHRALAVLLAAMIPWEHSPADLLAWVHRRPEYDRLLQAGVDPATAATLIDELCRPHRLT
ncbi:hypothetical protein [Pseudonocardia acaciae]|uniref:hypothetical protein n=1 Tax=Pseudonocardia acaciae TaxID=551276 RepID=UPI00048EBEDE|nr:hypothetical protein [Pseudonocardia acaciae]